MTKQLIQENSIVLNASFVDKWDAIRACGKLLYQNGYAKEAYIQDMIQREQSVSVYCGNHVAIPHGIDHSESNILESGICMIQVPDGVDFDGNKAYVLIGIAGKNDEHIELLGKIALVCMDLDVVHMLRTSQSKEEIMRILTNEAE